MSMTRAYKKAQITPYYSKKHLNILKSDFELCEAKHIRCVISLLEPYS